MYYCGTKKELLKRGFKKDAFFNDIEYCFNENLIINNEN